MGYFKDIVETLEYLVSEKLVNGLRILSGTKKNHKETRSETPMSSAPPDTASPRTARKEKNLKERLSSNRLGWYGKR